MQSSLKPKSTDDPHDFAVVPSDLVRVAPSDAEITDLLRAAARHRPDAGAPAAAEPQTESESSVPAVDTTFRATAINEDVVPSLGPTIGRRMMRGLFALLLAFGIGAAALTWQTFGYAATKAMIKWLPKVALTSSLPLEKLGLGSGSTPAASEPADGDAAPAAAADAPPAPTAAETTAADAAASPAPASQAAAPPPADSAQLLQSMARDLANVSQEVETLKASIAELKANQQQMAHDLAKANERAKLPPAHAPVAARKPAPAYAPTPTASVPAYRPTPSYPPVQAATAPAAPPVAQPYVPAPPVQLPSSDPGITSVPRPPMPVQ